MFQDKNKKILMTSVTLLLAVLLNHFYYNKAIVEDIIPISFPNNSFECKAFSFFINHSRYSIIKTIKVEAYYFEQDNSRRLKDATIKLNNVIMKYKVLENFEKNEIYFININFFYKYAILYGEKCYGNYE